MRSSRSTAPRPALLTTKRASISVARFASSFHEKPVAGARQALDPAIAHQRAAGIFHVALQGEHVGMLVDDAAGRAEQRGGAMHFGLELARLRGRDHAHAFDAVGVRALEQVQQHLLLVVAVGDDELAAVVVFDAARLAVGIQGAVAGDAEARLQAARRVVEAGVDHAAVARRGDGARMMSPPRATALRGPPAPARAPPRGPRRPRR